MADTECSPIAGDVDGRSRNSRVGRVDVVRMTGLFGSNPKLDLAVVVVVVVVADNGSVATLLVYVKIWFTWPVEPKLLSSEFEYSCRGLSTAGAPNVVVVPLLVLFHGGL